MSPRLWNPGETVPGTARRHSCRALTPAQAHRASPCTKGTAPKRGAGVSELTVLDALRLPDVRDGSMLIQCLSTSEATIQIRATNGYAIVWRRLYTATGGFSAWQREPLLPEELDRACSIVPPEAPR